MKDTFRTITQFYGNIFAWHLAKFGLFQKMKR